MTKEDAVAKVTPVTSNDECVIFVSDKNSIEK